jgi:hypothetical protein
VSAVLSSLPIDRLKAEVLALPQYEPQTTNIFHGGIYCREVWRPAGVLVIGKVHKKAHFYEIVSGTVKITQDGKPAIVQAGPVLIQCEPGTQRAVLALTDVLCRTFHATDVQTVEDAEAELVEEDQDSAYGAWNKVKPGFLKHESLEVLS